MDNRTKMLAGAVVGLGCAFFLCAAGSGLAFFLLVINKEDNEMATGGGLEPYAESYETAADGPDPDLASSLIEVSDFQFSDADGAATGGLFARGDVVHYAFSLWGLPRTDDGSFDLRLDLRVTAPDGQVPIDGTMIDESGQISDPLPISGEVTLPDGAPAGTYRMTFIVLDRVTGNSIESGYTFELQ